MQRHQFLHPELIPTKQYISHLPPFNVNKVKGEESRKGQNVAIAESPFMISSCPGACAGTYLVNSMHVVYYSLFALREALPTLDTVSSP